MAKPQNVQTFTKVIHGRELYLYNAKGNLIYKRWLDYGKGKVFHEGEGEGENLKVEHKKNNADGKG